MSIVTCYRVLGLSPSATESQVHRAYTRLAMLYHPDHAGTNPESHYLFCQITEAYKALKETFRARQRSERFDECGKCGRPNTVYQAMDGRYCCVDCLLPGRRRLLPMPKFEVIRCGAAISLQLLAAHGVIAAAITKDWHFGLGAAGCVFAALIALTINFRSADSIVSS